MFVLMFCVIILAIAGIAMGLTWVLEHIASMPYDQAAEAATCITLVIIVVAAFIIHFIADGW